MKQYCVYTADYAAFAAVLRFIHAHSLKHQLHLNRTRFWINPNSRAHTVLMLRYSLHIHCVDHEQDYSLGI